MNKFEFVDESKLPLALITLSTCRICLSCDGTQSIFVENNELSIAAQMMMMFTNLTITKLDGLPQMICTFCAEHVQLSYQLKRKCEKAEIILTNFFKPKTSDSSEKNNLTIESIDILGVKVELPDDEQSQSQPHKVQTSQTSPVTEESKDNWYESDHNDKDDNGREDGVGEGNDGNEDNDEEEEEEEEENDDDDDEDYIPNPASSVMVSMEESPSSTVAVDLTQTVPPPQSSTVESSSSTATATTPTTTSKKKGKVSKQCEECGTKLKSLQERIDHKNMHMGIKPYECPDCKKRFHSRRYMIRHQKEHTMKAEFTCEICSRQFKAKHGLTQHLKHMHEPITEKYPCSICAKVFHLKASLKKHEKTHLDLPRQPCHLCTLTFATEVTLKDHINCVHLKIIRFTCKFCDKGFYNNTGYESHMRTHTGEKPFKCDLCDQAFSVKTNWKDHMLFHSGDESFKCTECDRVFRSRLSVASHCLHFHGVVKDRKSSKVTIAPPPTVVDEKKDPNAETFECSYCRRILASAEHLEAHQNSHTGACEYCGKIFRSKTYLQTHINVQHTMLKPYKCNYCNLGFGSSSQKSAHQQTVHLGKKIKCDVCNKILKSQQSLILHMRRHTGEKPYKCKFCDKMFAQTSGRAAHENLHRGIKPKPRKRDLSVEPSTSNLFYN